METGALAEAAIRGCAVGALAATTIGLWRGHASASMRWVSVLFCLSVIGYITNSSPTLHRHFGFWIAPFWVFSLGGAGTLWLFVTTLFEDRPLTVGQLVPVTVLTLIGAAAIVSEGSIRSGVWIVHNVLEIALFVHALAVIYRSWQGDLVEARRRLRGAFFVVVLSYTILLSSIEIGESMGTRADWYPMAGAVSLALLCIAGAGVLLQARESLFGAATPDMARAAPGEAAAGAPAFQSDPADRIALGKLDDKMGPGEAWRREGLTIGALAQELGVPEHRLRRLINEHLGHRNFAAYVNAKRIAAAKGRLSDPDQVQTTVAAIAFDLGFGSLGPFNRAFKDATGQTPTEWRRQALGQGSPNSEKPG